MQPLAILLLLPLLPGGNGLHTHGTLDGYFTKLAATDEAVDSSGITNLIAKNALSLSVEEGGKKRHNPSCISRESDLTVTFSAANSSNDWVGLFNVKATKNDEYLIYSKTDKVNGTYVLFNWNKQFFWYKDLQYHLQAGDKYEFRFFKNCSPLDRSMASKLPAAVSSQFTFKDSCAIDDTTTSNSSAPAAKAGKISKVVKNSTAVKAVDGDTAVANTSSTNREQKQASTLETPATASARREDVNVTSRKENKKQPPTDNGTSPIADLSSTSGAIAKMQGRMEAKVAMAKKRANDQQKAAASQETELLRVDQSTLRQMSERLQQLPASAEVQDVREVVEKLQEKAASGPLPVALLQVIKNMNQQLKFYESAQPPATATEAPASNNMSSAIQRQLKADVAMMDTLESLKLMLESVEWQQSQPTSNRRDDADQVLATILGMVQQLEQTRKVQPSAGRLALVSEAITVLHEVQVAVEGVEWTNEPRFGEQESAKRPQLEAAVGKLSQMIQKIVEHSREETAMVKYFTALSNSKPTDTTDTATKDTETPQSSKAAVTQASNLTGSEAVGKAMMASSSNSSTSTTSASAAATTSKQGAQSNADKAVEFTQKQSANPKMDSKQKQNTAMTSLQEYLRQDLGMNDHEVDAQMEVQHLAKRTAQASSSSLAQATSSKVEAPTNVVTSFAKKGINYGTPQDSAKASTPTVTEAKVKQSATNDASQPTQQANQSQEPTSKPTSKAVAPTQDESPLGPPVGLAAGASLLPLGDTKGMKPQQHQSNTKDVEGEKDEHGCKISAGFQWCDVTETCTQPWMAECPSGSNSKSQPPAQQKQQQPSKTPGQQVKSVADKTVEAAQSKMASAKEDKTKAPTVPTQTESPLSPPVGLSGASTNAWTAMFNPPVAINTQMAATEPKKAQEQKTQPQQQQQTKQQSKTQESSSKAAAPVQDYSPLGPPVGLSSSAVWETPVNTQIVTKQPAGNGNTMQWAGMTGSMQMASGKAQEQQLQQSQPQSSKTEEQQQVKAIPNILAPVQEEGASWGEWTVPKEESGHKKTAAPLTANQIQKNIEEVTEQQKPKPAPEQNYNEEGFMPTWKMDDQPEMAGLFQPYEDKTEEDNFNHKETKRQPQQSQRTGMTGSMQMAATEPKKAQEQKTQPQQQQQTKQQSKTQESSSKAATPVQDYSPLGPPVGLSSSAVWETPVNTQIATKQPAGNGNTMQWAGMTGSMQMASGKAQEQQLQQSQPQSSKPQESNTKAAAPTLDESPWGPPVGLSGALAWSPFGGDTISAKQANAGGANAWTAMFNQPAAGSGNTMQWGGIPGSMQMVASESSKVQEQQQPSYQDDSPLGPPVGLSGAIAWSPLGQNPGAAMQHPYINNMIDITNGGVNDPNELLKSLSLIPWLPSAVPNLLANKPFLGDQQLLNMLSGKFQ